MATRCNGLYADVEILCGDIDKLCKTADALRDLRLSPSDTPMDIAKKMPQLESLLRIMKDDRKYVEDRRVSVAFEVAAQLASGTRQVKLEDAVAEMR